MGGADFTEVAATRSGACYSAASGKSRAWVLLHAVFGDRGRSGPEPLSLPALPSGGQGALPPQRQKAPLRRSCWCRKPSVLKDDRTFSLALEAGLGAGQTAEPGVCRKDLL